MSRICKTLFRHSRMNISRNDRLQSSMGKTCSLGIFEVSITKKETKLFVILIYNSFCFPGRFSASGSCVLNLQGPRKKCRPSPSPCCRPASPYPALRGRGRSTARRQVRGHSEHRVQSGSTAQQTHINHAHILIVLFAKKYIVLHLTR